MIRKKCFQANNFHEKYMLLNHKENNQCFNKTNVEKYFFEIESHTKKTWEIC